MRVVSLLPSTTEIMAALGRTDALVGITHECDFPVGLSEKVPAVTADMLAKGMKSEEIDEAVRASVSDSHTVYALDAERLQELAPDLVLSQSLCEVCAVSADAVAEAVCSMPHQARVLGVDPQNLAGVLASVQTVADAIGDPQAGAQLHADLQARLQRVDERVSKAAGGQSKPRVAVLEWPVPPFAPGHWVPDMIEAGGGANLLGRPGEPSQPIEWQAVLDAKPEAVLLAFCGFDAAETVRRVDEFADEPAWRELLASASLRDVFAVDGSGLFSRPGPRVVDGVEVVAELLYGPSTPGADGSSIPAGSVYRLTDGQWSPFESAAR